MFLVYVSAILTTLLWMASLFGIKDADASSGYILAIAVILWLTCLFANFAEAISEGRGKAQADSCGPPGKRMWKPIKIPSPERRIRLTSVFSAELKKGTLVIVRAGRADSRRRRGHRGAGLGG